MECSRAEEGILGFMASSDRYAERDLRMRFTAVISGGSVAG
jgi:hypothetical protein